MGFKSVFGFLVRRRECVKICTNEAWKTEYRCATWVFSQQSWGEFWPVV